MLIDQVKQYILSYNLLQKSDKVIVGVSGGPDSLALLYILHSLSKEMQLKLYVAHLDHMIRKESAHDKEFVRRVAAKLGLPCFSKQVEIRKLLKNDSLEQFARQQRLEFFTQVCKMTGSQKVALGHNLDDQAETVLMRILRGTGLYGLAGILPLRRFGKLTLVRPLLGTTRKEIELFLKRKHINALLDSTNLELDYFRNRVRHKLLPQLSKDFSTNIKQLLANLAESAGYDYDLIRTIAEKKAGSWKNAIPVKRLVQMHPALRRMLIRLKIKELSGNTRRITFRHVLEIEDLLKSRPEGSIVDLPKSISIKKNKSKLLFFQR